MNLIPPVLFLIFNRRANTQRVFDAIRLARPSRLFVAADGPREDYHGEAECCRQTRRIIDSVDWDCEVIKLYREENLGCRKAVSSAIDWFFDYVEEGIILEDDCLPSQSFFTYCRELLEYYRDDTRIMQISGSNFFSTNLEESYFFSKYSPIWGWATWRRAWKHYDVDMKLWPMVKEKKLHYDFCSNDEEVAAREAVFDAVYKGDIDTWDYQWVFARYVNSGLSITPCKNLVSNIGFCVDATHTTCSEDLRANMKTADIEFPIQHPRTVIKDSQMDYIYFEKIIKQDNANNANWFRTKWDGLKTACYNAIRSI